jgi:hypothetical protein
MANGTAAVSVRLPLAIDLRAPDPKWPQPPKDREDHAFFGPESGPGDLSAQDIELLVHLGLAGMGSSFCRIRLVCTRR